MPASINKVRGGPVSVGSNPTDRPLQTTNNGNKTNFADPIYRRNLSRWVRRLKTEFNLSDASMGQYISDFLKYAELSTGKKISCRTGRKDGYVMRWKDAEREASFQKPKEESVLIKFFEFCMTGSIDSNGFSATRYLETGDESMLPKNAWTYKKIPLFPASRLNTDASHPQLVSNVLEKINALELEVLKLNKRVTEMESQSLNKIKISFSGLLKDWVQSEAQLTQLTEDIIVTDLANKLGVGASAFELKDIIYGRHPVSRNKYKHYVLWIAALGILPYTKEELLSLPSGISLD